MTEWSAATFISSQLIGVLVTNRGISKCSLTRRRKDLKDFIPITS